MYKIAIIGVFASLVGLAMPSLFDRYRTGVENNAVERIEPKPEPLQASLPISGRKARLQAEPDGHFRATARMNGVAAEVLVDTGATYVAINETTARRLGIRLAPADFVHAARTANGEAKVALARIDRIAIGRIEVRDVKAMVTHDDALGTTLLGMSFLSQLRSFQVNDGTLDLEQ
ncbi:TIGR02281 family clan AA aspartic protease [Aurantimonas sp. MSK8Z-1]|uniref:retropepsin-like aspartic protease family protein n=1 Tax=Mangrovibrevibacter kandeliae TaxID=2968473 RepID=UPI002117D36A|nr:TIGR02281 family clan AA aspartic protease [Aurantimonas sp. MSK8Z-1]MCW4115959.1 TIGR02281 family clan AA aspartic protease [Aurantimonas sp. MSK8Z-1]